LDFHGFSKFAKPCLEKPWLRNLQIQHWRGLAAIWREKRDPLSVFLLNDFGKSFFRKQSMGGYNSGRHSGKGTLNDMRSLDVRQLQRNGQLRPGHQFRLTWTRNSITGTGTNLKSIKVEGASISLTVDSDCVTLAYFNCPLGGEWQAMNYPVRLAWTACHYGGERVWWICPVAGCGRRVAVLYGGAMYACRHCQQRAYQSQQESREDLEARRANKLRARLGWKTGIFNPAGGKPKGMHWMTYWRLKDSHDAHAQQILGGIYASLGRQPLGAHQA
jgi:hypothetical protein